MSPGDPNQYTVKEILTDFVLPSLEDLRKSHELQRQADDQRFKKLEDAKARMTGALVLVGALIVPLTIPVINLLVSH